MAVFVHVKRGGNAPSPFLLLLMDVTQNKTKQNKTKQNKTKRNETKRNGTERNRRENDHAMKDNMETPPCTAPSKSAKLIKQQR